ncbi:MAG: translation initiation factor IF-2 [Candidatus Lokiarchaeota archaeon]|nr:translation initiation factor IF-2 [Candidatus Lokiarchaeota archaeon]MBD3200386.1 translation initiation factor IF-2 [Candidatus Lokiarchaeota archaeon]
MSNAEEKVIRAPIACILGHIDHGKTSLLDYIRGTVVQEREAAGITQHIGASFFPIEDIKTFLSKSKEEFAEKEFKIPGLLIVDTPGHAAFLNLRKRGGAVADIAILVVDIMSGTQPITWESVRILRERKTPFIIAANKIDRIPGWKSIKDADFSDVYKKQKQHVKDYLDEKLMRMSVDFLQEGYKGIARYDKIKDFTKKIAVIPTSAKTGEGISTLLMVLMGLVQQYLTKNLKFSEGSAQGVVLEVKKERGYGKTMDVLIYNGNLHKGDEFVVGGLNNPIKSKVRALLTPKPMDEIRDPRQKFDSVDNVSAAAGIKVLAPDVDEVVAGSPFKSISTEEQEEQVYREIEEEVEKIKIRTEKAGVVLKADTLGSLEALENHFSKSNVSISVADVGAIKKEDIINARIVKDFDPYSATVLGFNVPVFPEAEEQANKDNIRIFTNNVIYRLLEDYLDYAQTRKAEDTAQELSELILPAKLKMFPQYIFRNSSPAVFGVNVEGGTLQAKVQLMTDEGKKVGRVHQLQDKGQNIDKADKGAEVAISIRGIEVGRDIEKDETLFVKVPESHVRQLIAKFLNELTTDQKDVLREYIKLMREIETPWWGM